MLLALDVGEKRIGVATAGTSVKIAVPLQTIQVDGSEIEQIIRLVNHHGISKIIVGYPRNQSGETTAQTKYVESFATLLQKTNVPIQFQDESLTSVHAEDQLKAQKKPYQKGDIDKLAAALILQDYLETL